LDANQSHGRALFMRHCYQCHPGGEAGVGPAINNKSIPDPVMKLQIRQGVLGTMPKFPSEVISDQDVHRILDYLAVLGEHDR
jgi:mono/diheme cytochrome c family protein